MKTARKSALPTIHILRTRFKKDIVCEFLPPAQPSREVIRSWDTPPRYGSILQANKKGLTHKAGLRNTKKKIYARVISGW